MHHPWHEMEFHKKDGITIWRSVAGKDGMAVELFNNDLVASMA